MHTYLSKRQTINISFVSSVNVCNVMSTKYRWFVHKGIIIFVLKEYYPILTFEDLIFIAESIKEEYNMGFVIMTELCNGDLKFLTSDNKDVVFNIEYRVLSLNKHIYG